MSHFLSEGQLAPHFFHRYLKNKFEAKTEINNPETVSWESSITVITGYETRKNKDKRGKVYRVHARSASAEHGGRNDAGRLFGFQDRGDRRWRIEAVVVVRVMMGQLRRRVRRRRRRADHRGRRRRRAATTAAVTRVTAGATGPRVGGDYRSRTRLRWS